MNTTETPSSIESKIVRAAASFGGRAHVARHWMDWGSVTVQIPASAATTSMGAHLLARTLPHFAIVDTLTNRDGTFTARGRWTP